MHERFLFGALLMLYAAATAVDISLVCNVRPVTVVATQEQGYAVEPQISQRYNRRCCARIVTTDAEAPLVLLRMLRLPDALCNATLVAISQPGSFLIWTGQLQFAKAILCKEPSERYMVAANNTQVCLSVNDAEPASDGTTRPFAFTAVSASNVCEPSAWLQGAMPALVVRPSYVYAPDERLPELLPGVAPCAPDEDFVRVVHAENVSSFSGLRAEVLAIPDNSSCRSLFVQGQTARTGYRFAVAAGNQLTISYNRSRGSACDAVRSQSIGFVVRLSDNFDTNSGSSLANFFASVVDRGSSLSGNSDANSRPSLASVVASAVGRGSSLSENFDTNSRSSIANVFASVGDRGSRNALIVVLCASASRYFKPRRWLQ